MHEIGLPDENSSGDAEPPTAVLRQFPALSGVTGACALGDSGGFSGARIWRLASADGDFALRRWPPGWDGERLRGLHELLVHLARQGLDFVAVPCTNAAGTTLVAFDDTWWQVEPWLPGRADFHSLPSDPRLAAAMVAVARWHRAAATFTPRTAVARWFASRSAAASPAIAERWQRLSALSARSIQDWSEAASRRCPGPLGPLLHRCAAGVCRAAERVRADLREAARLHTPLQPCLRDIWHDHVLYSGDQVTGLIDPSACRTESVAADLARLIGSLVGDDWAAWDRALAAYAAVRPLSLAERRLVPVLDRSGVLLSAATWLEWLGPGQRPLGSSRVVAERLERLVARLERL